MCLGNMALKLKNCIPYMRIHTQARFCRAFSDVIEEYIDSNNEIDFEKLPKAAVWSMSYYCMPRQVRDALEPLAGVTAA